MRWAGLAGLSAVLWWCLYIMVRRRVAQRRLATHLVSLAHSLTSVLLILALKSAEGKGLLSLDFELHTRPHEEILMASSLGYFLYDSVVMKKCLSTSPMILHHLGSCVALTTVLVSGKSGTSVLVIIFILEGSNPFLHVRRILQCFKLDKGHLYFFFQLIYLAMFLLFRFGLAGLVSYDIFTGRTNCQPAHIYIAIFFNFVSCLFLGVIVMYIVKKYFNKCKDIKTMN